MMHLPRPAPRRHTENTIPMINIVFLLLMFFLVAGSLAPRLDPAISLVAAEDTDPAQANHLAGLREDGTLVLNGEPATVEAVLAHARSMAIADQPTQVFIAVDAQAPANRLVELVGALRDAGADNVVVVTERLGS